MEYFLVYNNLYDTRELIPTNDFDQLFIDLGEKFGVTFGDMTNGNIEKDKRLKEKFLKKEINYYSKFIRKNGQQLPVGTATVFHNPLSKGEENE